MRPKKPIAITGLERIANRRLLKQLPADVRVVSLAQLGDVQARKHVHLSSTAVYGAAAGNPTYLAESAGLAQGEVSADCVLRVAPIIGPTIDNEMTRFFSRRVLPVAWGFDPLLQFLHEDDLAAALTLACELDGVFNVAGDGVLTLSSAAKLTGALRLPLPTSSPIDLRWPCLGDNAAFKQVGFAPRFSSKDAFLDFAQTLRLRRIAA